MPHLSPMNWLIVPVLLMFTLTTLMIIMWWQISPQFPTITKSTHSYSMNKLWYWW
uniref:ATP synthase F0 subunit 8 n=1 Tax=Nectoneanthes oxypoda TaxID=1879264 RepID=UPI0030029B3E|nr:ATP synthase F0 subunit 8 [Nectoneanthes oxypoda]